MHLVAVAVAKSQAKRQNTQLSRIRLGRFETQRSSIGDSLPGLESVANRRLFDGTGDGRQFFKVGVKMAGNHAIQKSHDRLLRLRLQSGADFDLLEAFPDDDRAATGLELGLIQIELETLSPIRPVSPHDEMVGCDRHLQPPQRTARAA